MHATAFAASPSRSPPRHHVQACAELRKGGVGVWFTLDAGPNPVLLTSAGDEGRVVKVLEQHGATEVVRCAPGGDATVGA